MRKRRVYALVAGLAAVASVALMLAFIIVPGGTEGVKSPTAITQEVVSTPSSPAEGIAVHGHWTIEVKNPDGTLAERREFDNALSSVSGGPTLAKILARLNSVGGWRISLLATSGESAFLYDTSSPSSRTEGNLVESTFTDTYPNFFKTLTVSLSTDRTGVVLSGTATAAIAGNIGRVKTQVIMLSSSQPSSSTYVGGLSLNDFTDTTLTSPVSLTAGQTVTVTVVISFS